MPKPDKTNAMRLLDRAKLPYQALEYPSQGEAIDALQVAALLGQPPETVFKTLVLLGSDGGHYVCVLPGPRGLDLKKAASCFKVKSLHLLPVNEIKDVTGYVRGGCTPLGMKKPFPTLVDASALTQPLILVSGGRIGLQIKLRPEDLLAAAGAATADLVHREP
ncbi:MAG: Cys-tRNA(Pro) deacylase [Christensenellales bacterium]